jgi:hypothetical protein
MNADVCIFLKEKRMISRSTVYVAGWLRHCGEHIYMRWPSSVVDTLLSNHPVIGEDKKANIKLWKITHTESRVLASLPMWREGNFPFTQKRFQLKMAHLLFRKYL